MKTRIIGIVLIILTVLVINIEYNHSVNNCVKAGYDINFCKNELAK